ncbi:MAG: type II secretion system protein [Verrucomicrobia bacterium]|nr:MAG: type II secretion system protein [Verrucomicrobiota bacterium]
MRSHRAFTLIELLAVIAIIGVLASILVPVVGAVRSKASATKCLSNMRQVGVASLLYLHDHKGRLPSSSHERNPDGSSRSWQETLKTYLGPTFIGRCPSRPDHRHRATYGWSDFLTVPAGPSAGRGILFSECRRPSATLMLAEITDQGMSDHLHFRRFARGITFNGFRQEVRVDVHDGGSNYLFVDAHVRRLTPADVRTRLANENTPFIIP